MESVHGRGCCESVVVADADGHVEELGELARELQARVGVAPAVAAVPGPQADLGARLGERAQCRADGEGAVALPDPAHRGRVGCARGAGDDLDRVGDQETGQQADAELAEELAADGGDVGPLGGAADDGQQRAHVVGGEADAVVADDELLVAAGGHDLDRSLDDRDVVAERGSGPDGVVRVLHELAQVDALVAVEVVAEDLDEAAQVNREPLAHGSPPFPARASPVTLPPRGYPSLAPQILRSCSIRASLNRAMARLARARSSTR